MVENRLNHPEGVKNRVLPKEKKVSLKNSQNNPRRRAEKLNEQPENPREKKHWCVPWQQNELKSHDWNVDAEYLINYLDRGKGQFSGISSKQVARLKLVPWVKILQVCHEAGSSCLFLIRSRVVQTTWSEMAHRTLFIDHLKDSSWLPDHACL